MRILISLAVVTIIMSSCVNQKNSLVGCAFTYSDGFLYMKDKENFAFSQTKSSPDSVFGKYFIEDSSLLIKSEYQKGTLKVISHNFSGPEKSDSVIVLVNHVSKSNFAIGFMSLLVGNEDPYSFLDQVMIPKENLKSYQLNLLENKSSTQIINAQTIKDTLTIQFDCLDARRTISYHYINDTLKLKEVIKASNCD